MINIFHPTGNVEGDLTIPGSKSISNRVLILKALLGHSLDGIDHLSTSKDTTLLYDILKNPPTSGTVDIEMAGTAMRFLTSYFAIQPDTDIILTGKKRMLERPIKPLVDALLSLGADISYEGEEGYPPLRIKGKKLKGGSVSIRADMSSQYITSLLLIAPFLKEGLKVYFQKYVTSASYINMTLSLLMQFDIKVGYMSKSIAVLPLDSKPVDKKVWIESDWSSASYIYSIVAMAEKANVSISHFSPKQKSIQGDSVVSSIYRILGVETTFDKSLNKMHLTKRSNVVYPRKFRWDFIQCPDLAQTVAVTCAILGLDAHLSGLSTLKIKETDRIHALKEELKMIGCLADTTDKTLSIVDIEDEIEPPHRIEVYNDHRMAMAFAAAGVVIPMQITEEKVVEKSYPTFWDDMKTLGFDVN